MTGVHWCDVLFGPRLLTLARRGVITYSSAYSVHIYFAITAYSVHIYCDITAYSVQLYCTTSACSTTRIRQLL